MEANDGVHLPGRRVPGLRVAAEPLGEAVDAIVRRATYMQVQSVFMVALGELVVARLRELQRAYAPEGARR